MATYCGVFIWIFFETFDLQAKRDKKKRKCKNLIFFWKLKIYSKFHIVFYFGKISENWII